jgi:hypothetical protein
MTPRKHDVVQPTIWFIDAILGRVHGVFGVRVALEGLGIDALFGKLASNDKSVLRRY